MYLYQHIYILYIIIDYPHIIQQLDFYLLMNKFVDQFLYDYMHFSLCAELCGLNDILVLFMLKCHFIICISSLHSIVIMYNTYFYCDVLLKSNTKFQLFLVICFFIRLFP